MSEPEILVVIPDSLHQFCLKLLLFFYPLIPWFIGLDIITNFFADRFCNQTKIIHVTRSVFQIPGTKFNYRWKTFIVGPGAIIVDKNVVLTKLQILMTVLIQSLDIIIKLRNKINIV